MMKSSELLDAFDCQSIRYFVKAGDTVEVRECPVNCVDQLPEFYKIWHNQLHPIFEVLKEDYRLPHISWERTPYSLCEEYIHRVISSSHCELVKWVDYLFWETSSDYIIKFGLPTNADVQHWIEVIKTREDLSSEEKSELIELCKDYLKAS